MIYTLKSEHGKVVLQTTDRAMFLKAADKIAAEKLVAEKLVAEKKVIEVKV